MKISNIFIACLSFAGARFARVSNTHVVLTGKMLKHCRNVLVKLARRNQRQSIRAQARRPHIRRRPSSPSQRVKQAVSAALQQARLKIFGIFARVARRVAFFFFAYAYGGGR
jgi:hypothetical protein